MGNELLQRKCVKKWWKEKSLDVLKATIHTFVIAQWEYEKKFKINFGVFFADIIYGLSKQKWRHTHMIKMKDAASNHRYCYHRLIVITFKSSHSLKFSEYKSTVSDN